MRPARCALRAAPCALRPLFSVPRPIGLRLLLQVGLLRLCPPAVLAGRLQPGGGHLCQLCLALFFFSVGCGGALHGRRLRPGLDCDKGGSKSKAFYPKAHVQHHCPRTQSWPLSSGTALAPRESVPRAQKDRKEPPKFYFWRAPSFRDGRRDGKEDEKDGQKELEREPPELHFWPPPNAQTIHSTPTALNILVTSSVPTATRDQYDDRLAYLALLMSSKPFCTSAVTCSRDSGGPS